jgi:hypothetical protein
MGRGALASLLPIFRYWKDTEKPRIVTETLAELKLDFDSSSALRSIIADKR